MSHGSLPAMDASWTEGFGIVDLPGGKPGKHSDYATGTTIVPTAAQAPRMNAITERWIGGCRRELLDRALIWNQAHLRRILGDYEAHHNQHRPHRSLHGAATLKALPEPVDPARYRVRRQARAGGLINEYRLIA